MSKRGGGGGGGGVKLRRPNGQGGCVELKKKREGKGWVLG